MSLNEMLTTWPRERLEKELAQQAKENAALRERVARLESELFWLKVPAPAELDARPAEPSAPTSTCWCHTCRPVTMDDCRMVLCPTCGNKRCPRANDHRHECTNSNEPGQAGSAYPGEWTLPGETPP